MATQCLHSALNPRSSTLGLLVKFPLKMNPAMGTEELSWLGLLGIEPERGYLLRRRIQRVTLGEGSGLVPEVGQSRRKS